MSEVFQRTPKDPPPNKGDIQSFPASAAHFPNEAVKDTLIKTRAGEESCTFQLF